MARASIAVTPGTGDTVEFDETSDSRKVQAIGLRRSDDNKELATVTADGVLVSGVVTANHPTTGIGDGRTVTVSAGTRVAIASTTSAKWVTITAESDNTGVVVVGGTTCVAALATRRGIPLSSGETYGPVPVDNLADVYIDSTVSGDGVTFTYGTGS